MQATSIQTVLLTLLSVGLTRYINTGDRVLDQNLLMLGTLVVTSLIAFIGTNTIYLWNLFLSLWKRDPMNMRGYMLETIDALEKMPQQIIISRNPENETCYEYVKKRFIEPLITGAPNTDKLLRSDGAAIFSNNYVPFFAYFGYIVYLKYDSSANIALVCNNRGAMQRATEKMIEILKDVPQEKKVVSRKLDILYPILANSQQSVNTLGANLMSGSWPQTSTPSNLRRKGTISPNKTFNTLVYEQKPQLLTLLQKFRDGRMYPSTISMDNKLGILLYGPPGTGKTGTISAIANLLQRHVIMINFSEVTTCAQLDTILSSANNHEYIYVFDEFDCILNVLTNPVQTPIQSETKQERWHELLAVAEGEERKEILSMIRESKKPAANTPLDLAYLLSKLDGLEDNNGRLIIATTNNPEKINPALLRPGRFDIKLCLGNCTTAMYTDILSAYFGLSEDERRIVGNAGLPEKRFSPLEVINMALTHQDLTATLQKLLETA